MKKLATILICTTLVGCASSPRSFDMSNHERIDRTSDVTSTPGTPGSDVVPGTHPHNPRGDI